MRLNRKNFSVMIKLLVSLKLVFFFGLFLFYKRAIFIGEIGAFAQTEGAAPSPENAPVKETPEDSEAEKISQTESNARVSLLDGLLTLPKLDPEKIQKDEIGRYLNLAERAKRQAEDRIALLKEKAAEIEGLEKIIDEKLKKLDEERQFFLKTIQQEKEIQKDRLETLVGLYQKMEPKKAAPVIASMDKDLAIALLKNLAPKQVTKIMELMDPAQATQLTEYYGRVGSAREYEVLKEMNKSLLNAFDKCKVSGEESPTPENQ